MILIRGRKALRKEYSFQKTNIDFAKLKFAYNYRTIKGQAIIPNVCHTIFEQLVIVCYKMLFIIMYMHEQLQRTLAQSSFKFDS